VREAPFRLDIAQQLKAAGNDAYKQVGGLLRCFSLLNVLQRVTVFCLVWFVTSTTVGLRVICQACAFGQHCAAVLCCWQGDAATALARYQQAARFLSWTSFKLRDDGGDVDMSPEEQVRRCSGRGCAVLRPGFTNDSLFLYACFGSSCMQHRISCACSSQLVANSCGQLPAASPAVKSRTVRLDLSAAGCCVLLQRALWDCEMLLMGNAAAAQLKLGRFRAADETCRELLQK
jgi:hypothetical protein